MLRILAQSYIWAKEIVLLEAICVIWENFELGATV
jgi:hypothetical protein